MGRKKNILKKWIKIEYDGVFFLTHLRRIQKRFNLRRIRVNEDCKGKS